MGETFRSIMTAAVTDKTGISGKLLTDAVEGTLRDMGITADDEELTPEDAAALRAEIAQQDIVKHLGIGAARSATAHMKKLRRRHLLRGGK